MPKTTTLDPYDEYSFQEWYRNWAQRTGININPDDPLHFYDYRAAWKERVTPTWDENLKEYHWPSKFKLEGHPRMILDGVNTKTGIKIK